MLVDLDSCNGTEVDGAPVTQHRLQPGQEFNIRGHRFVYELAPAGVGMAPAVDPEAQVDINGQDALLDAIFQYRWLRTRAIQGLLVDIDDHHLFHRLEQALRSVGTPTRGEFSRYFQRFTCLVEAEVRLWSGEQVPAMLVDVGIDGARAELRDCGAQRGDTVWVSIRRPGQLRFESMVLSARVAWVGKGSMGFDFSGKPAADDVAYNATIIASVELEPEPEPASRQQSGSLIQRLWGRVAG